MTFLKNTLYENDALMYYIFFKYLIYLIGLFVLTVILFIFITIYLPKLFYQII